jgi:MYXO-CTERM domain-containing protein
VATTWIDAWRAGWRAALVGIVVALAGPAQAAVYTGIWDPVYGAPFSADLGWRGSATFSLPPGCLAGTADLDNGTDCGGAAVVTQATVELYDAGTPGHDLLATLVFDPLTIGIQTLRFVDGDLTGLATSLSAALSPGVDLGAFGVSDATVFALQFTLAEGPRLGWLDCSRHDCDSGFNDAIQFPPSFTITAVDEPGTAALGALALGLLAAGRRRRR